MKAILGNRVGPAWAGVAAALLLVLCGCANKPNRAPVEERIATLRPPAAAASAAAASSAASSAAIEQGKA
ncbi:MAG: hypothetical protein M3Y67_06855, partial [Pseudomonadota bacterium]|nr:hypothetical protein [Pseudomonadota bacterium]